MTTRSLASHPSSVAQTAQRDQSAGTQDGAGPLAEPSRGRLLTINAACKLVGVDQSTLRRWSNAGKVPVYRTPGGHRRYHEDDLRALLGDGPRRQSRPRLSRQILTDRSLSSYEGDYVRGARKRQWYSAYPASTLDDLRRVGRRLVDLAIRYVATGPAAEERARLLAEGCQIGEIYGRTGAQVGLSVSEMVEAFLYFRNPVIRSVLNLIDEEDIPPKRAVRVYSEVGQFMDEVLIATVRAHEEGGALTDSQLQRLRA